MLYPPNKGSLASCEPLVRFKPRTHRLRGGIVGIGCQETCIRGGLQGLQEKGLQSRSATASLLIKNCQCMQEEI